MDERFDSLLDARSREPEHEPGRQRQLDALVALPEMDAVGRERDRRLYVVVDDQGRRQLEEGATALDQLARRHAFEPQLHDRGSACDGHPRGLEIVDDRVQLHRTRLKTKHSIAWPRSASAIRRPRSHP